MSPQEPFGLYTQLIGIYVIAFGVSLLLLASSMVTLSLRKMPASIGLMVGAILTGVAGVELLLAEAYSQYHYLNLLGSAIVMSFGALAGLALAGKAAWNQPRLAPKLMLIAAFTLFSALSGTIAAGLMAKVNLFAWRAVVDSMLVADLVLFVAFAMIGIVIGLPRCRRFGVAVV